MANDIEEEITDLMRGELQKSLQPIIFPEKQKVEVENMVDVFGELVAVIGKIAPLQGDTGSQGEKGDKGNTGLDGSDGLNGIDGKDGKDGKDGLDVAPDIVAELKADIEKLEEQLEVKIGEVSRVARRVQTPRYVNVPIVDDFSGSTNGSLKAFTLSKAPKSINTMLVHGSDSPLILRPTIDFTIAGKILTLTAEVDAPSSGATLIAHYYI